MDFLRNHQGWEGIVAPSLMDPFNPIFYPEALAVVGASADPTKFGNIILSAIQEIGYGGKIYPVNPEGGEINGLKVFKSMPEIPGPVDFAIITVPASALFKALEECRDKGVKGVEILTSGFKETGTPEGRQMEAEIARFGQGDMRILGPNCFGIYCPES
jgi:acyl-CoA synthetase (NDP forming)